MWVRLTQRPTSWLFLSAPDSGFSLSVMCSRTLSRGHPLLQTRVTSCANVLFPLNPPSLSCGHFFLSLPMQNLAHPSILHPSPQSIIHTGSCGKQIFTEGDRTRLHLAQSWAPLLQPLLSSLQSASRGQFSSQAGPSKPVRGVLGGELQLSRQEWQGSFLNKINGFSKISLASNF